MMKPFCFRKKSDTGHSDPCHLSKLSSAPQKIAKSLAKSLFTNYTFGEIVPGLPKMGILVFLRKPLFISLQN